MKFKFIILLSLLAIIAFIAHSSKQTTQTTPNPQDENIVNQATHPPKRFVVKYANATQQFISQFNSQDTAIDFAASHIFKEGFSLHYVYDRETKSHLAGDKIYDRQDDILCIQLDVVVNSQ